MRSVHEYTTEFMRLAERNDLRESEGQHMARYLEVLKPQIRDKIGVQMMRNFHEAKNMALRAKFLYYKIEGDMSPLGGIMGAIILGYR